MGVNGPGPLGVAQWGQLLNINDSQNELEAQIVTVDNSVLTNCPSTGVVCK
jgi:hypothetical protein